MSLTGGPEDDGPLERGEVFHIIPEEDSVEHYESPSCICEPIKEVIDPHNDNVVWVHRFIRESLQ